MTVYFLTEEDPQNGELLRIKIGFSKDLKRRLRQLQTGNPDRLALMGEIRTRDKDQDRFIEADLHRHFSKQRQEGSEWFYLYAEDIVETLKSNSANGYITVGNDPFEIISYDSDVVPEFAIPWAWGDVEVYEFCPACGWAGGWSYNENYGGERCLQCGVSEHDYSFD